ncbi:MAG: hydrolase [Massilia sp.]|jgi:lysophospholipase L1-like esterase|nr:hydrolase [Massilia sp.]MDB5790443.1 hydrolase [Massilia sp.]
MKHAATLLSLSLLAAPAFAASPVKPVRIILVGDSTMATRTGYGDALCARFQPGVSCINLARGGRSSGSFRAEGRWDEVQALLKDGASFSNTYVLLQFGHNDQPGKPGRSTDLVNQFPRNIDRYVAETTALGGVPVLVTPLTRRTFKGRYLKDDLAPWAAATRRVASERKAALIDLNAISAARVQQMGQDEADTLAQAPRPANYGAPATPGAIEPQGAPKSAFDRTHVGEKGAALFSGMVSTELQRLFPGLTPSFRTAAQQTASQP